VKNDGSVFGLNVGPAKVGSLLRSAKAPTDWIRLDIDALLVKMPEHVVLFDTGLGVGAKGVLLQSLRKAGVQPSQVTDVFITHAHFDHMGGLLNAQGGLNFPNATVRMSANEWSSAQKSEEIKATVDAIRPKVKTFVPGKAVLPGVTPLAVYGHTPGHANYQIESKGKRLRDIGDLAHSSIISLGRPEWAIEFDMNRPAGIQQRRSVLAAMARSQTTIFAPHFPYPGIGHVVPKGAGYTFRPVRR
jgi:glyoxylase-like metal-dependent hydrolase (beta-lactamase superfamily II)